MFNPFKKPEKQTEEDNRIWFNRAASFGERFRQVREQVGTDMTRQHMRNSLRAARRKAR